MLSAACKAEIVIALQPRLSPDAVLCTDGSLAMATAAKHLGVHHEAVNLSGGERVRGAWHIQNANACHSRLQESLADPNRSRADRMVGGLHRGATRMGASASGDLVSSAAGHCCSIDGRICALPVMRATLNAYTATPSSRG